MPSPDTLDLIQSILEGGTGTEVPQDFQDQFVLALTSQHIDMGQLMGSAEFDDLLQRAYADPYLQDLYVNEDQYGIYSIYSKIATELFSPQQSHNPDLAASGLQLKQSQGIEIASTDLNFLASSGIGGGNAIVNLIMKVAGEMGRQAGLSGGNLQTFENIALATAYQESGFDPRKVGDGGHSVGLFQLHDQGEGAGMGDTRYDPETNARRALQEFLAVYAADPSVVNDPAGWAVKAQKPDNKDNVAWDAYNAWYQEIAAGKIPTQKIGLPGIAGNLPTGTTTEYGPIISAYKGIFGREPNLQQLYDILNHGSDLQQWTDYIRSLPSHIPGMKAGQYTDLRALVDSTMQKYLGHDGTDGIVKELFDSGDTSPLEVQHAIGHMSETALKTMGIGTYSAIRAANAGPLAGIYGETGFDPRVAVQQHAAAGGTPATNTESADAGNIVDLPPLPPTRPRVDPGLTLDEGGNTGMVGQDTPGPMVQDPQRRMRGGEQE